MSDPGSVAARLAELEALSNPTKAAEMAAYHKAPRRYLGVANPELDRLARAWRADCELDARLALAEGLWQSDIHEARVAAAKLLTQARIRPDDTAAWEMIKAWVPDFDAWAIADHAAMAGQRRLAWRPARLDDLAPWTTSDHMWTRRAALVMTLGFAKSRNPSELEQAARTRILGWIALYASDPEWFIQKACGWWLRDLSKRDPDTVRAFLDGPGTALKPFSRRIAATYLAPV